MLKIISFVIIFCFAECYAQTIISPQFSELKGLEDQSGNTHLFYRIYTYYEYDPIYQWTNHIYHWDKFAGVDTLFLTASGYESPGYNFNNWVSDVDFWNNNPAEFIYSGGTTAGPFFEGSAYISRFDGFTSTFGLFWETAGYVDISSSDDSLLYAGIVTDGGPGVLKSADGARSWDSLSVIYQFLSLNPDNENIYFVEDEDRKLFRTTDTGNTFNLVDPEFLTDTRFYYDSDSLHIYRKAYNKLIVSDNLGEQFSWQTVFTKSTTDPFYFSYDFSVSGSIFISDGKNIFYSLDYGDNFYLYKTLDRKIVGIYKKPNSNKLYSATKYTIYEITPDTIHTIKSLPIPDEVLSYYPLVIGNKWVYDYIIDPTDPLQQGDSGIYIREVLSDTMTANGKQYYKIIDETLDFYGLIVFERVDTLTGKVYRYFEHPSLTESEYLIHDLLAEVGDTVRASRYFYDESVFSTVLPNSEFNKWGITKPKKVYQEYTLSMHSYSFVKELGLDSIYYIFDFGYGRTELKGCIIDGVVYGDTTVVFVDDKTEYFPIEYSISQNYPNPFNPTTKIYYQIPEISFVTIKVYDVLGSEVATLLNEEKPLGNYEVNFNAASLPSGIYFYRLKAGSFVETKKMVLMK